MQAQAPDALPPGDHGRGFGYGGAVENSFDEAALDRLVAMGMGWVKLNWDWSFAQREGPQQFDVVGLNVMVDSARARNLQVLVRVNDAPGWAGRRTCATNINAAPPTNPESIRGFVRQMAQEFRGRVTAYEIWNEPNVSREWGGCGPNPGEFAALMRQAFLGVREGDPGAVVVSGGLSNTGNGVLGVCPVGPGQVCGDLLFLQRMYEAGARAGSHWDAIGYHPYGGTCAPEVAPGDAANPCRVTGLYFRRMEDLRNIINDFGVPRGEAPLVPIWATEMGWVTDFDRGCHIGSKNSEKVTLAQQADYTIRAYQYAAANWPWAGPLILFLVDANVGKAVDCDPGNEFRWYSLFNEGGVRTVTGNAFAAMSKVAPQFTAAGTVVSGVAGAQVTGSVQISNRNGIADRYQLTIGQAQSSGTLLSWRTVSAPYTITIPVSGGSAGSLTVTALANSGNSATTIPLSVCRTGGQPNCTLTPVLFRQTAPPW